MSKPNVYIIKASGESVPFSEQKLARSLDKAGAPARIIEDILRQIEPDLYEGISTQKIYRKAFKLLKRASKSQAARYNLKNGIMELGPSGFPFEKFISELMKSQGFKVEVGVLMQGHCVTHEVDVLAEKDHTVYIVECKFHNRHGYLCDVKIPLYIHSRFRDLEKRLLTLPDKASHTYEGYIVTNTKFSPDAIQYGNCAGLHLVGWDYPKQGNLKDWIEKSGLYPITCLSSLNRFEREKLLEEKTVLCQDLYRDERILARLGLSPMRIKSVVVEARQLCEGT